MRFVLDVISTTTRAPYRRAIYSSTWRDFEGSRWYLLHGIQTIAPCYKKIACLLSLLMSTFCGVRSITRHMREQEPQNIAGEALEQYFWIGL